MVLILNYSNYALRRIRDAFRENKALAQPQEVMKQYQFANENLNIIRRQVSLRLIYTIDGSNRCC